VTYRSVIGSGEASLVMDPAEKRLGLDLISAKYAGSRPADYPEAVLARTQVIRVTILQMTGKASGTCGYPL
jgi:nitroimidazol reductase NimA-like FMN-containing flavoprotein (pyridoxamine 5'-phosphate oxidase superfamily)